MSRVTSNAFSAQTNGPHQEVSDSGGFHQRFASQNVTVSDTRATLCSDKRSQSVRGVECPIHLVVELSLPLGVGFPFGSWRHHDDTPHGSAHL